MHLVLKLGRTDPGDLKNRIEAALKRHAELEARQISVSTKDGSVVLEGSVHSWAEREEAEAAVWASPGIRTVEDRLKVAVWMASKYAVWIVVTE